jgi:hypothetical protein
MGPQRWGFARAGAGGKRIFISIKAGRFLPGGRGVRGIGFVLQGARGLGERSAETAVGLEFAEPVQATEESVAGGRAGPIDIFEAGIGFVLLQREGCFGAVAGAETPVGVDDLERDGFFG